MTSRKADHAAAAAFVVELETWADHRIRNLASAYREACECVQTQDTLLGDVGERLTQLGKSIPDPLDIIAGLRTGDATRRRRKR